MFLQVVPEEYIVTGSGNLTITISVAPDQSGESIAGIVSVDEDVLEEGHWIRKRRLNGDETGQGRVLRLEDPEAPMILRVKVYRYH